MLPDTLDEFSADERTDFIMILTLMASCDGRLVREEMAAIEDRMGRLLLHPEERAKLRRLLSEPPDLEEVMDRASERVLRLALRDGMLLCASDGQYHSDEIEFIEELAERGGIDEEGLADLYDWITEGWHWMARGRCILDVPISGDVELLAEIEESANKK